MAKRLTDEQWDAIRREWEGTPTATYETSAAKIGKAMEFKPPTKGAVSNRAQKEGWSKAPPLASINDGAQRRADSATTADGELNELNGKLNQSGAMPRATRDESEIKRAEVLTRHRTEWAELEGYRRAAVATMGRAHEAWKARRLDIEMLNGKEADLALLKSLWSIAKTAAETARANLSALEAKQQGERRAWGLALTGTDDDIIIANPRREDE